MATKDQFCDFEIHLNDADRVAALQANPPAPWLIKVVNGIDVLAISRAPDDAAVEFASEPLGDGTPLPFVNFIGTPPVNKPYIYSAWFTAVSPEWSKNFPTDVATFVRKSGGWFGIDWLFGSTTRFYWRGVFVYDSPLTETGAPGAPPATGIAPRLWIDMFPGNMGGAPNNPSAPEREYEMSRDAGRTCDTFGIAMRGATAGMRQHTPTEYTGGGASSTNLLWERLYLRWRKVGDTLLLWRAYNSAGASLRVELWLTTTGQIAVTQYDSGGVGTLVGTAGQLVLGKFIKLDIISRQGVNNGAGQPIGGQIWIYINGAAALTAGLTAGKGFNAIGFHSKSEIGTPALGFTSEADIAFWMGAEIPFTMVNGLKAPIPTGGDFINGSRAVLVRPTAFDASHAGWTGPWQLLSAAPVWTTATGDKLTSTTPLARLAVAVNLAELNTHPGGKGCVGMVICHHGYRGTANGRLGYQLNGGADVWRIMGAPDSISNEGTGDGARVWGSMLYTPSGTVQPPVITSLVLLREKGNDAVESGTDHLTAVAEIMGTFHDEDYPPNLNPALQNPLPFLGIHNAPYPRSIWARSIAPPTLPVMLQSGTYTGNGTAQDIVFKVPPHWIWIQKSTNIGSAPIQGRWFSSMLGAGRGGRKSPEPWLIPDMGLDPTFSLNPVDNPPTGAGAMPNRSAEVAVIVNANLDLLDASLPEEEFEASRRDLCRLVVSGLNATIPADGNNWGLLRRDDRGGRISSDIIVWKPDMNHVDIMTDTGPLWSVIGVITDPLWFWVQVTAEQQEQRSVLHIAGANTDVNQAGETYGYVAVCDPGMRFMLNGAAVHSDPVLPATDALIDPYFLADAAFYYDQRPGTDTNLEMGYKGPGHTAAQSTKLNTAGTTVTPALTLQAGSIVLDTALGFGTDTHLVYNLWRRNDGSEDPGAVRVVQIGSYTGDGAAGDRIIELTPPSARRPLWAIIVPHGAQAYQKGHWHTGGNSSNMSGAHATTAIKNAPAPDRLTVGATLNTATVVYDYFVIVGACDLTAGGPDGFSLPDPNGCFPVDPIPPKRPPGGGGWGGPPEKPPTPPGAGPPGGDPLGGPGGGADDIEKDLSTSCVPFTKRIFNDALSRIGISKRVVNAATDNTEEADLCRQHYARAIEQTLRDFPWPFATRYNTLALLAGSATSPVNQDWTYAYRRPVDCVFERRLAVRRDGAVDPTPPPFQLSYDNTLRIGRLLSNQASAQLEYTARPECTAGVGDPLFLDALTWRLAARIAGPLTRVADVVKLCIDQYDAKIANAFAVIRPGNPGPRTTVDPSALDSGTGALEANILVVNRALIRIGAGTIANLATAQSREGEAARVIFEEELTSTLRDFPWPFATSYATLVLVSGPTPPANADWLYAYRRPVDCVFERRLVVARSGAVDPTPPPFQLASDATGGLLVTNRASAVLEYTSRMNSAVLRGDALFRDAFAWRLAASLAPSLARIDPEIAEQLGRGPDDPTTPTVSPATNEQLRQGVAAYCQKRYEETLARARAVFRPGNPGELPTASTLDTTTACLAANVGVVNRGLIRIGARTIANLTTDQSRESQAARMLFEDELKATLRDFPWAVATKYEDLLTLVRGPASVGVTVQVWSATQSYAAGDTVSFGGSVYYARLASLNQTPPNATYWTTTATVSANADWTFAYRSPADCVLVRRIVTETRRGFNPAPELFRVGQDATGTLLFCNRETPTIEYTARLACAVGRADPLFRDAFAWRLAASLAPSLAQIDPEQPEQVGRGPEERPRERKVTEAQLRARASESAWRMYYLVLAQARVADANEQQPTQDTGDASWISERD